MARIMNITKPSPALELLAGAFAFVGAICPLFSSSLLEEDLPDVDFGGASSRMMGSSSSSGAGGASFDFGKLAFCCGSKSSEARIAISSSSSVNSRSMSSPICTVIPSLRSMMENWVSSCLMPLVELLSTRINPPSTRFILQ